MKRNSNKGKQTAQHNTAAATATAATTTTKHNNNENESARSSWKVHFDQAVKSLSQESYDSLQR